MRVIAGTARGTKLKALAGEEITRPTIDRVKEGMFSSLQFVLPGAKVLDLYAGSGQLGIEALSRGAAHCTFVDENRQALAVVQSNCKAAGVQANSEYLLTQAAHFLKTTKHQYHIALLDPPYHKGTLIEILPLLDEVMLPGAVVLCESERTAQMPEQCGGLQQKKQYRYGTVLVTRYEKER